MKIELKDQEKVLAIFERLIDRIDRLVAALELIGGARSANDVLGKRQVEQK